MYRPSEEEKSGKEQADEKKISDARQSQLAARTANGELVYAISLKDAKDVWNKIAESTLKGEDLAKFKSHLGDVDE